MARLVQEFTFFVFLNPEVVGVKFEFITFVDEVMPPLRRSVVLNTEQLGNFLKGVVPSF